MNNAEKKIDYLLKASNVAATHMDELISEFSEQEVISFYLPFAEIIAEELNLELKNLRNTKVLFSYLHLTQTYTKGTTTIQEVKEWFLSTLGERKSKNMVFVNEFLLNLIYFIKVNQNKIQQLSPSIFQPLFENTVGALFVEVGLENIKDKSTYSQKKEELLRMLEIHVIKNIPVEVTNYYLRTQITDTEYVIGGIYSVPLKENLFATFKVLQEDELGVHVAMYTYLTNNFFAFDKNFSFPKEKILLFHLPILKGNFTKFQPYYSIQLPVEEIELEGYELWKQQNLGYFNENFREFIINTLTLDN